MASFFINTVNKTPSLSIERVITIIDERLRDKSFLEPTICAINEEIIRVYKGESFIKWGADAQVLVRPSSQDLVLASVQIYNAINNK